MSYEGNDSPDTYATITGGEYNDDDWGVSTGVDDTPISISFWFKSAYDELQRILRIQLTGDTTWDCWVLFGEWTSLLTNEIVSYYMRSGRRGAWGGTGATRSAFFNNVWHNVIITNDASGIGAGALNIYVDNVLKTIGSNWWGTGTHEWTRFADYVDLFGSSGGGTSGLDGRVAEFGFWKKVLSSDERALLQTHSPLVVPGSRGIYIPATNNGGLLLNDKSRSISVGANLFVASDDDHPPVIRTPVIARRRRR